MTSSQTTATIGDLLEQGCADLQTGPFGTMLHASAYGEVGTPVIAVKNIGDNRLVHADLPRVSDETADELARYRLAEGDILFSRKGSVERRAIIQSAEDGWIQGSDCIRLRLDRACVSPEYVSFALGGPMLQRWLRQHAQGATMPSLNQEILRRLPLALPSLEEQRAIAAVLGALDDKIERNRKMSLTLDESAEVLFRATLARAGGQTPGSRSGATEACTFEPLGKHIEVTRGLSYSGKHLSDAGTGLPLVNLNSVLAGGGYDFGGLKWYSGDYRPRHLVGPGSLVVANTDLTQGDRVLAYPAIVPASIGDKALFSHHLYRVTPRSDSHLSVGFLYFMLRQSRLHKTIWNFANGTTVNMLPADALAMPRVVVPSPLQVAEFTGVADRVLERQDLLNSESVSLAALRDTLLPKLLAGDIQIADVEKAVGQVV